MFRVFGKITNLVGCESLALSPGFTSQACCSSLFQVGSPFSAGSSMGYMSRLYSSASATLSHCKEETKYSGGFSGGLALKPVSLLTEQRRHYMGNEGRIAWRRKREKEHRQREKILEPVSPVIDYKYPWPKDDTESLPPELFGEDIKILSPEEERNAQNAILTRINKQISENEEGRLFAVIHVSGKQFKVTAEDIIVVQGLFNPTNGDQIRFHKVLLVGGTDFTIAGRPIVDKDLVRVEGTVIEKTMSYTKYHFKMIKREDYRKIRFVKDGETLVRINLIKMMQPLEVIKSEFERMEESVPHYQQTS